VDLGSKERNLGFRSLRVMVVAMVEVEESRFRKQRERTVGGDD
jgi:hypothetical protein